MEKQSKNSNWLYDFLDPLIIIKIGPEKFISLNEHVYTGNFLDPMECEEILSETIIGEGKTPEESVRDLWIKLGK